MKKFIPLIVYLIAVLGLFSLQAAIAQSSNQIQKKAIALMKPGNTSISLMLGEPTSKALQVLGDPNSIADEYWEHPEITVKVYTYGRNKLYFYKSKLDSYEINDSSISVGTIHGQTFKVTDFSVIKDVVIPRGPGEPPRHEMGRFILNYQLQEGTGSSRGKNYWSNVYYYVMSGSTNLDSIFEILLDANNKIINISVTD
ncbi:hypothetical protein [Siphonobacter sp. SORGH_AS_0500]|uniref:hypothetical protein n=1 Tax=Siphonobacter sp. SORGH_AS_0500 TaxID=1864824 RepID=UPI002860A86E|nr:hypothetical protein [Siphonobacter sp. SORGH_AS_0500]MDR6197225.1 hypothetical protein [Siphonobacter sp. SORGH_AS_0500]